MYTIDTDVKKIKSKEICTVISILLNKMLSICPIANKSKKKIINKAVGGMAGEKIKVEIKQEGGGYLLEILSQRLAAKWVAEGQMDKSEELIRVNTERPSWANLALR